LNAILSASLFGGLCAVDNRTSLRLLFSQPICSGLLTGLALGSPAEGFLAGALFQMMFLGVVTLRGEKAPDLVLGGVAAAALYIVVLRDFGEDPVIDGFVLALSLLVALCVSYIGREAYKLWEGRSHSLSVFARSSIARGHRTAASAAHLVTVVREGCSLDSIYLVIPFIGVGSLVRFQIKKTHIFFFAVGFLVSYVLFLTRG
jgi:mannose/fructose/N-acetylgalactosamine-specific phosphotransferase system component IIC